MNHCFKSVLNLSSGASQVTSEKPRNGGRTGSSVNKLALATLLGLSAGTATANIVIDSGMTQSVPSGMQFDAAGYLVVGGNTFGQLSIASGGEATNTDAYVGFSNGSQGEVFVSGTGAKWTTNGFLTIGFDGQAIVIVDIGASAIVRDGTDLAVGLNSFAQLTLSGTGNARGLFSTPYIMKGIGTGLLQWDGGILQARSNELEFFPNFTFGDINITNNGAFFDTNGYNVGIQTPGILIGTGGFTKLGAGTLTIAGNNSWNGDTTVNAGTLALGSYTQSGSQTLTIGVADSTNYGRLQVSGVANFNNSNLAVNVIGSPTLANNLTLTGVVTAGTLNATNFIVTDNSALFDFNATVNSNSVDLNVIASGSGSSGTTVYGSALKHGLYSALGAASVLDTQVQGTPTGDMANVVTALGRQPDERSVARAVAQTLPLISGNQAVQGTLSSFQKVVQNQMQGNGNTTGLSSGDALSNKNAWGKVFGSRAEQDDRSGAAGFKADTWGMALGADAQVAQGARFGVAYGYAKTSVNGNTELNGSAQRANIGSHIVALYGSKDIGDNRTFSFQGDLGVSNNESTRHIDFGGLNRSARADYRTYSAHIGIAISQAFALNEKTTLTPTLRADYTWLKSQGYTENGADALNLAVGSNKADAFVIGADGYLQHRFSNTSRLDAYLGIGYDAINELGNIISTYAGAPGQAFVTTGIDHSPWLVRGGIGYSVLANNGTEVSFRYDAEGRSEYLNHTASVRAKWTF
jgi:outer membrane autotransporter protein